VKTAAHWMPKSINLIRNTSEAIESFGTSKEAVVSKDFRIKKLDAFQTFFQLEKWHHPMASSLFQINSVLISNP